MPVRVFHGDDSESYRHLIREVLTDGDIEIVGGAGTPDEVIEGVERTKPDVILLDQFGGAPLMEAIRSACPGAKVIVLSGFNPEDGDKDLAALADAYVVKSDALTELEGVVLGIAGQ
ncbi:MAG TPA: response regulator [Solirubrobacteraceae bacterium]|nr:response regulator [Solirubrobacteraceae bacterium]